jgi:membrane protein implicated in regulation of membrane protease activity
MFGLPSLQKLIVLALVVAVVWYGFRFLGRLQKARKEEAKLRQQQGAQPAKKAARDDGKGAVEDLVPCPSCGAYVRAGSTCSCGRKA